MNSKSVPVIGFNQEGTMVFNSDRVMADGKVDKIPNPEVRYWLATNRHLSEYEDAGLEHLISPDGWNLLTLSSKELKRLAKMTTKEEWGGFTAWYNSLIK